MKLILFILLLIPLDKQKHYFAGTLVGSWGSMLTINEKPAKSFGLSMLPVVVIGASKEVVYDKWMHKGTPEWKDFGWTVVGGVTGYVIVRGFKWFCERIDTWKYRRLQPRM